MCLYRDTQNAASSPCIFTSVSCSAFVNRWSCTGGLQDLKDQDNWYCRASFTLSVPCSSLTSHATLAAATQQLCLWVTTLLCPFYSLGCWRRPTVGWSACCPMGLCFRTLCVMKVGHCQQQMTVNSSVGSSGAVSSIRPLRMQHLLPAQMANMISHATLVCCPSPCHTPAMCAAMTMELMNPPPVSVVYDGVVMVFVPFLTCLLYTSPSPRD